MRFEPVGIWAGADLTMTAGGAELAIRDVPEHHRYELLVDGVVSGFVDYRLRGRTISIDHTEVDPACDGRGYGSGSRGTSSTTRGRGASA